MKQIAQILQRIFLCQDILLFIIYSYYYATITSQNNINSFVKKIELLNIRLAGNGFFQKYFLTGKTLISFILS